MWVHGSIRCVHPNCGRWDLREVEFYEDSDYVGVVALGFHSNHEGHDFELFIEGRRIWPPEDTSEERRSREQLTKRGHLPRARVSGLAADPGGARGERREPSEPEANEGLD